MPENLSVRFLQPLDPDHSDGFRLTMPSTQSDNVMNTRGPCAPLSRRRIHSKIWLCYLKRMEINNVYPLHFTRELML